MKKIVCFSLLITAASFASCIDSDKVDRNPGDGVFNGGRSSGSENDLNSAGKTSDPPGNKSTEGNLDNTSTEMTGGAQKDTGVTTPVNSPIY